MAHGDGKFKIVSNQIVKRSNGEIIPENEPIMILRGRDRLALPVIREYFDLCRADGCTEYQLAGIRGRIDAFMDFAAQHPELMKQPGITEGK